MENVAIDSQVAAVIGTAIKETLPKFDEFLTIAFTYDDLGRWHETQVTFREYSEILVSGEIDGRKICAVELFDYDVRNEAEDRVKLIYDFMRLNTNQTPWRVA